MINGNRLKYDLMEKVHKEHFQNYKTGAKGIYYLTEDVNACIDNQSEIGEWIPCSEWMPEERESMFAKSKGTDKWNSAMFEKISDTVNVTVENEKGERATLTAHTVDGKWKIDSCIKLKVIAWMPFPKPYSD